VAVVGLVVSTGVAIISAADKEKSLRAALILFASVGFVASIVATWQQHITSETETRRSEKARAELAMIKAIASSARVDLADLAALNAIGSSGARYHIQLSVDPKPDKPCKVALSLNKKFPGIIERHSIRVVKRPSWHKQPYLLLFGKDLTLAAADVLQQLAAAQALSNGLASIEPEQRDDEDVPCSPSQG